MCLLRSKYDAWLVELDEFPGDLLGGLGRAAARSTFVAPADLGEGGQGGLGPTSISFKELAAPTLARAVVLARSQFRSSGPAL